MSNQHPASAPRVSVLRSEIKTHLTPEALETFEFILNAWTEDTTKVQIQEILTDAHEYDAIDVLREIQKVVNA